MGLQFGDGGHGSVWFCSLKSIPDCSSDHSGLITFEKECGLYNARTNVFFAYPITNESRMQYSRSTSILISVTVYVVATVVALVVWAWADGLADLWRLALADFTA